MRKNWKVYKDPVFPAWEPAGKDLACRVKNIDALRRVLLFAAPASFLLPVRRCLVGYGPGGEVCAEVDTDEHDLSVMDGLGQVTPTVGKLSELPWNPRYESFLLGLMWKSAGGWPSEMHVLALYSGKDPDIEWVYDEQH